MRSFSSSANPDLAVLLFVDYGISREKWRFFVVSWAVRRPYFTLPRRLAAHGDPT
jgi:hypothetical protein